VDTGSRVTGVIRAALTAALIGAALTAGCGGHKRTAGMIVFQSAHGGALYAVRPDGKGLTRLRLKLPASGVDVAWTRDGTRALVTYDTLNGRAAFVFDAVARKRLPIRVPQLSVSRRSHIRDVSETPWSPDGKQLVLGTNRWDVAIDVTTGARSHLSDDGATGLLSWSADGKDLLFPVRVLLYAAPADGGAPKRLGQLGTVWLRDVQPSPDGKWLAFARYGYQAELHVARPDGSGLRMISPDAASFAWSPAGDRLLFADPRGIAVADVDKDRVRRLVDEPLDDPGKESAAWSPDGRRILYQRTARGYGTQAASHTQLWTMNADGSGRRPLTKAFSVDSGELAPVWVAATLK
jgi:Tol biopolymer transport system component